MDHFRLFNYWKFRNIYALRKGALKAFSKQILIDGDTSDSGYYEGLMNMLIYGLKIMEICLMKIIYI